MKEWVTVSIQSEQKKKVNKFFDVKMMFVSIFFFKQKTAYEIS